MMRIPTHEHDGHHQGPYSGKLVDMGPFATLPIEQLLETDDVGELLRRLERTSLATRASSTTSDISTTAGGSA